MDGLKPCPKCGNEVKGYVNGCCGAFGCGEWDYEVECKCGLLWNAFGCYETEQEAEEMGIKAWNDRYEPTCRIIGERDSLGYMSIVCSVCKSPMDDDDNFCSKCGAKVVD